MIFKFSEPKLQVVPVNELTSFLAVLRDTSAQFGAEYPPVILDVSVHGDYTSVLFCWRFEVA